jgi:hypothetical protein
LRTAAFYAACGTVSILAVCATVVLTRPQASTPPAATPPDVLVPTLAPTPAAPSSVPRTLHSCETHTATLCADWRLDGGRYLADWTNGSHAEIVINRFDADSIVFTRDDPSGVSAGMHAVYRGAPVGGRVRGGVVTWSRDGLTFSGPWEAQF